MELIISSEAALDLFYIVLEGNLAVCKNEGTSSGTLSQIWDFFILQLHVDCHKCCQLRWTLRVID